jgi:DNA-binding LytR/AlgR family response regulator
MDFLKAFQLRNILVVITSANSEYALEGYQLDVIDYLLKPFSFERFMQSVQKTGERLLKSDSSTAPEVASIQDSDECIIVKADHKSYRVKIAEILYIEGMREYVTFHCVNQKLVSLESLKNLMESVSPTVFMRVHKSFIVNKQQVKALYGNQLQLHYTQKTVPVGQTYREKVRKILFYL